MEFTKSTRDTNRLTSGIAAAVVGILIVVLFLASFNGWGGRTDTTKASASATTHQSTTPSPSPSASSTPSPTATPLLNDAKESGKAGVENHDGTVKNLPIVKGTGSTIVIDTTNQKVTPPLLDGSLRFTAQTLSWAGIVERVGDQQWFKDGIDARSAQTGFTWKDVKKFAKTNKMVDGKVQGVNALAIQVYNLPKSSDKEVRNQVRKYITPDVEKIIGITVDELPIQHIDNGFVNTRRAGTATSPKMGEYFDTEQMIRVSLMPIKFDKKGNAVGLDGSRGAGIFIDCGNLHWVPKAMWECTKTSCEKPACPAGATGTPPNCEFPAPPEPEQPWEPEPEEPWEPEQPKPVCQWNPQLPPDSPDCLQPKGNNTPKHDGWKPLGPGPLTDGKKSQEQKDTGKTRGNAVEDQVPENTKSGDVTPDTKPSKPGKDGSNKGGPVAPEAKPGGDDRKNDVTDEEVTKHDDGGTNGATEVESPF